MSANVLRLKWCILDVMNSEEEYPQLMLPLDYVKLATKLVKQAQQRVYVVCLNINRCSETNKLIDEILKAARRGVDVHIGADLLTFICDHDSSVASRVVGRDMVETSKIRAEFLQAGADFNWLGAQRVPWVLGRTHSKWTIIDDDVFAFGGVNLGHAGIMERTDYMFHFKSAKIADRLSTEQRLIESPDPERRLLDVNAKVSFGNILIDSGKFGRSGIYRHATKLAKDADKLLVVSQYCPTGRLGKIIKKKNTKLYFNPKGSANDMINNVMIGSKVTTSIQENLYTRERYLHAKFMIGTMPDGTKRAITGSHNFAAISGRAGTREIALETTQPEIIEQLEAFYENYIK